MDTPERKYPCQTVDSSNPPTSDPKSSHISIRRHSFFRPISSPSPFMDVAFTPKLQSPLCSVSHPFSPGLLPLSTRREFLGCGSHLRPPSGLRSLKRFKKSGLQFHSPRCLSQEFSYEDSVLTAAAVVAAFTAFQFIYLNHKRKRRSESPKVSGSFSSFFLMCFPFLIFLWINVRYLVFDDSLSLWCFFR